MGATIDITEAFKAAQRVPVHAVIVGDSVFDAFGNPHTITDLALTRVVGAPRGSTEPSDYWVKLKRDDTREWEFWTLLSEEVTIVPTGDRTPLAIEVELGRPVTPAEVAYLTAPLEG